MSFNNGPTVITNGLVLALDAGDRNSYVSGSTTWFDLTGVNNGTLINGPTFNTGSGGSIVFDGVNDYVNTSYNGTLTDFTIGIWFRQIGNVQNYSRLIDKNYSGGTWVGRSNSTNTWGGGVKQASSPYGRFITLSDGDWHYIVSRREGTTHTIFGDGITNTTSGTVTSTALDSTALSLGATINDGLGLRDFYNGNISILQIYNRALSASEVLQNYNATKGRFGL